MNALLPALLSASVGMSSLHMNEVPTRTTPAANSQPDSTATVRVVEDRPIIRVSGTGEVQRRPDYAVIYVGVDTREKSAQKASDSAGTSIAAIVKAIELLRIPGTQIQTSDVRLNPAYRWESDDRQHVLLGYDASSVVKVRIDDPKAAGKVIDAATGAGANRVDGISFEINQALEARQEALRLAARAAKQKAETLAEALEMRIHCVIEATTTAAEPRLWMGSSQLTSNLSAAPAERGGFEGSVEPGFVTISAEATVTFAAKPR